MDEPDALRLIHRTLYARVRHRHAAIDALPTARIMGSWQVPEHLQDIIVRDEVPGRVHLGKPHHTLLVDHEPGPLTPQVPGDGLGALDQRRVIIEHTVGFRRLTAHVTQQGVGQPELFRPGDVGVIEIHTHAQNLGMLGLKLGKIQLKGQGFLRSRFGEGANIEEQHHRLFSQVVRKLHRLPSRGREFKHGRFFPHLEGESLSYATNAYRAPHNEHNECNPKSSKHPCLLL